MNQVASSTRVTAHSLTLSGLTGGTTYYFRVSSADAAGNNAVSSLSQFKTTAPIPPPQGPQVLSVTLINADTDTPVTGFDPMADGAVIRFADLPTRALNIRANTSPSTLTWVRYAR